jgi:HK97 family phage prohead protease
MLLHKTLSLADVDLKLDSSKGRFSGYASVFGGVDSVKDTIVKGAFEATLQTHGMPKMFFNHEWRIGKFFVAEEDQKGLYVEGELTPGLSLSADVDAAMKHGTIDGLSIGGMIKKGDFEEPHTGGRVIRKWTRLLEISAVVFPADGAARIQSVKSEDMTAAIEEIETIRDFECFLRDAGGLSKGAALALTARVKTLFAARDAGQELDTKSIAELAARVNRLASLGA